MFLYKPGDVWHLTSFYVITLSAEAWRCWDGAPISVADPVFLSSMPVMGDIMNMAEVNISTKTGINLSILVKSILIFNQKSTVEYQNIDCIICRILWHSYLRLVTADFILGVISLSVAKHYNGLLRVTTVFKLINNTKTLFILSDIHTFSPYRAVNTLRLGYKNQSVNGV